MPKKIHLSILSPTYQNEAYIAQVVKEIYKDIVSHFPSSCEVIIYETGSQDKTKEILINLQKKYPLRLITTTEKREYIPKVKKLYKEARGELIFFLDSDGECPPKAFWQLYKRYQNGNFDIITAFRKKRKPIYRRLISKADNFLIRNLFGLKTHDANCGFRLVKTYSIRPLMNVWGKLKHNSNAEQLILANKKGLKIAEINVSHRERKSVVSPANKILKQVFMATLELMKFRFDIVNKNERI